MTSCDHSHMPLYYPRNKRKKEIKSKKIDKMKENQNKI